MLFRMYGFQFVTFNKVTSHFNSVQSLFKKYISSKYPQQMVSEAGLAKPNWNKPSG